MGAMVRNCSRVVLKYKRTLDSCDISDNIDSSDSGQEQILCKTLQKFRLAKSIIMESVALSSYDLVSSLFSFFSEVDNSKSCFSSPAIPWKFICL